MVTDIRLINNVNKIASNLVQIIEEYSEKRVVRIKLILVADER
jgi:hypothetical protein